MEMVGSVDQKPVFCNVSLTIEEAGGAYSLSGVTLAEGDARIKISFGAPRPLDKALRRGALQEVQAFLDRVDRPTGIWSFPGDRVVLKDLILADPRLVVSRSSQHPGTRLFVLRFQRFFGQIIRLFDESVTIANPLRSQLDDLAFRTIERALLPLFNIAEFVGSRRAGDVDLPRDKLEELLSDLRDRISDLHLHYLVLSQHVAGQTGEGTPRLSRDLMTLIEDRAAGKAETGERRPALRD